MAHITLSQLTTVLQRIVSWATGKFAAKNTYSGKLEYADMPVVVLASMGSELDGTSTQRTMSAGFTYYLPAEQGAGARIMFVDSNGTAVKISDPVSNVIYCNAYTGLLYRWDESESDMVPVGGDVDGLRKVYVGNNDFSSLDTLYSGVYQVIEQSTQRVIGVLAASSDNKFGANPYFVTQWLFSNLMLSDEYSGSLNNFYTTGRAHIIQRFYNASNSYSDIPLNTWSEWKVYGLTLDEMSGLLNSKVSSISVNGGTAQTPDGNGNVNVSVPTITLDDAPTAGSNNAVKSGGIKTALDGKANVADVPTKTEMSDAIDDALGEAQVTVVPAGSVGVISSLGSDSTTDALSASMGKKLKVAVLTILNSLGNYAFPGGKPQLDFGGDSSVTYTVQKTIGTGLSATGGDTDVALGDNLEVTIAITDNLYIIDDDSVVVTMGGQSVAGAWDASTKKVTIAAVTGNVVINVPSLTYVQNGLAFQLDCKNRGGQSGHWIDRIGSIDFTLGSAVAASDNGVVFDGTTNSYGETNSALTIAPSAGTIEAVVAGASGEYNPILINPVASGDNDNIGLCILNWSEVEKIATMSMRYPSSNDPTVNCSADTGSVTDFALSLSNQKYMNKGVGSTPGTKYSFLMNTAHTKLTLGRSRRPASDSRGDIVFVGTIKAIRVYSGVLTEAQQMHNWKVDQKRFNIS